MVRLMLRTTVDRCDAAASSHDACCGGASHPIARQACSGNGRSHPVRRLPFAGDLEGPKQWGGVCQSGARQSPINIPLRKPSDKANVEPFKGAFEFTYDYLEKISVLNTGHGTPQVRASGVPWENEQACCHVCC